MTKISLISGITGQDGSYLADHLLHKKHVVVGLHRRNSTNNFERISHIKDRNFLLEEFDLTDSSGCNRIISKYKPDYFFNLPIAAEPTAPIAAGINTGAPIIYLPFLLHSRLVLK